MVSTIKDWAPQVGEVKLPSGHSVMLKTPDFVDMLTDEGEVPDVLRGLVMSLIGSGEATLDFDMTKMTSEQLKEIMKSLNAVAIATFDEPKLWKEEYASETHMPVKWVPFQDKVFVMSLALGGRYETVKTFPEKPDDALATVRAESTVSTPSE